jgi:hypothetical protein
VLIFNSAIVLIDWPATSRVRQLQNADMDVVAENVGGLNRSLQHHLI